jgi:formylglycine-generating enzyme required for sulfatase activity
MTSGDKDTPRRDPPHPLELVAAALRRPTSEPPADSAPAPAPAPAPVPAPEPPLPETPPPSLPPAVADPQPQPRKSSDILSERLIQIRHRAEETEQQRDALERENQTLREQLRQLRETPAADTGRVEELELELARARDQAAADLEALTRKLQQSTQDRDAGRNVDTEAALQALRQETALLQNAAREKDKVLEELTVQCRDLEDHLEDREREIERLNRELDQARTQSAANPGATAQTAGLQDTTVLDGSSLIYIPGKKRAWQPAALAVVGSLLLGVVILQVMFLLGQDDTHTETGVVEPPPATATTAPQQSGPATPQPAATAGAGPSGNRPAATTAAETRPASPATSRTRPEPEPVPPRTLRDRLRDGSPGPLMVRIPAGAFVMGSSRAFADPDEQPPHKVQVPEFWIGVYEVTFEEYDRFARAAGMPLPNDAGRGRDRRPVVDISWEDAAAYARWLSAQTGARYRLPSEAEWEYAARGGSEDRYWWGFDTGDGRAVCFDCGGKGSQGGSAPVGSLPANPFGLFDTAGNVMEWVQDCYHPNYRGAPIDGSAWLTPGCPQGVGRGGAYNKPATAMRNAARASYSRSDRFDMLGFRLARE